MQSIIEKIKDSINIVDIVSEYLDLQKKGKNFWGICPFHEDNNPSMSVSPEKQMFKCFVCGEGGNVINFVSEYEKIPFSKAIAKLAKKSGIEYKAKYENVAKYTENQKKLILAMKDANDYFMLSLLSQKGKAALEYAHKRNLTNDIIEKFSIGYASEGVIDFLLKKGHDKATLINASLMTESENAFVKNRLSFALKNKYGDIIGFSSRLIDGSGPKYINSAKSQVFNKSSLLYNFDLAKDSINKFGQVYINEGFMDVIAMYKSGIPNSVAIMGTALTAEHIPLIRNKKVVLMLDSDEAGINATLKSIKVLLSHQIKVSVVQNVGQKDPDEIFINEGVNGLKKVVDNQISGFEYAYQVMSKQIEPNSPETINNFIKVISEYLKFCNEIELDFYRNKISQEFAISIDNIKISKRITKHSEPQNVKPKIKSHNPNYEYQLIKSILKKPHLAKIIVKNPVNLSDPMLLGIVKFLVASVLKRKLEITYEAKEKLFEINKNETNYAHDEREFLDIINNLNRKWKKDMQKTIKNKLNTSTSMEDKIAYLEQIKKVGKK